MHALIEQLPVGQAAAHRNRTEVAQDQADGGLTV
jgi:hypothetical protein